MAEWWTKQSFCPFSGVMKPKPFASLHHFTLPVVRMFGTSSFNCVGVPCLRYLSDYCLFAAEVAALAGQKTKKRPGKIIQVSSKAKLAGRANVALLNKSNQSRL